MTESLSELIARSFAVSNNRIKKLEAELAALKASAGELEHDIERHIAIAAQAHTELAEFKYTTPVVYWDGELSIVRAQDVFDVPDLTVSHPIALYRREFDSESPEQADPGQSQTPKQTPSADPQ